MERSDRDLTDSNSVVGADRKCHCSKNWVLIVHNDFRKVEKYERIGNDADVENLKRVFQLERNCRVAELANCNKERIIGTLAPQQNLIQLFYPDNNFVASRDLPECFYLFILSHGESGGKIFTDHFQSEANDDTDLNLESYSTNDVCNSLASHTFLRFCTKLLFFASCRGKVPELNLSGGDLPDEKAVDLSAGWLTSKPNREDFIIFYATVENTSANRSEYLGTWFIHSICTILDEIQERVDILTFFTRVQYHVCQRTRSHYENNASIGQTPQLHFLANKYIQICARHFIPYRNNNVETTDCRPSSEGELVAHDAKSSNTCQLIEADERIDFYNWGLDEHHYARGKAMIFYDEKHFEHAKSFKDCFQDVGYVAELREIEKIWKTITCSRMKRKFENDGSLVLCVLSTLRDTNSGLVSTFGETSIPLCDVVDQMNGRNCKYLVGKPKLFFFLDKGTKKDSSEVPKVEIFRAKSQFTNVHSGVCTFVGTGSGDGEGLLEKLVSILQLQELRNGKLGLQTALVNLIGQTKFEMDSNMIRPQLISTLPVFVNFPSLPSPAKPALAKRRCQIIAALGVFAVSLAAICIAILLSGSSPKVEPSNDLQLEIRNNCKINFLPNNSSIPDAFSIDEDSWIALYDGCEKDWSEGLKEWVTVLYINAGHAKSAVNNLRNSDLSNKQHLKLAVLLAYEPKKDLKLAEFCSSFDAQELKDQCFTYTLRRMTHFRNSEKMNILTFWYYLSQNESHISEDRLKIAEASKNALLEDITADIFNKNYYSHYCTQFSSLKKEVQCFYIVTIVSNFFKNNYALLSLKEYFWNKNLFCFAMNQIYLQMKNDEQLDSMAALQLRAWIHLQRDIKDDKCADVERVLLERIPAHTKPFLNLFDQNNFGELSSDKLTEFVVDQIVKERYNDGKNAKVLMDFMWPNNNLSRLGCVGSFALAKQMKMSGQLASFEAIALFSQVYFHRLYYIDTFYYSHDCMKIMNIAPVFIKRFLYNSKNCECCESSCFEPEARKFIDALLTNSIDTLKRFPKEVLFIGYCLHSLQSPSEYKSDFSEYENNFKGHYNFSTACIEFGKQYDNSFELLWWFNLEVKEYITYTLCQDIFEAYNVSHVIIPRYG